MFTGNRRLGLVIVATLGLAACDDLSGASGPVVATAPAEEPTAPSEEPTAPTKPPSAPAPKNTTVNDFLTRGEPTFVVGTAGDDLADRVVRAQVDFTRQLFPSSKVVLDTAIDAKAGAKGWPDHPVVYGGPHVNHLLAKLALPLELSPGKLVMGEETLKGDDYLLMAVIPARAADDEGPGYPEFLLYAGTGTPGIAEINSVSHGPDAIFVADTFGKLTVGSWKRGASGRVEAKLSKERARRIPWRAELKELAALGSKTPGLVRFMFPEQLPAADDESKTIDACMRGLATVVQKLEITAPVSATVYVHPDRRSKESLTGYAGDGHAMISSKSLHVIRFEPAGLERLMAHEGTHILGYQAWGPPGSSLLGEGVAVWVSGYYAGKSLAQHKAEIDSAPAIADLLSSAAFRKLPEQQSYPVAGLLVDAVVSEVGLPHLRDHLLGATAETWTAACERAGTTPSALQDALSKRLK